MSFRQAVILCGGLGTRLGALTAETPKPLLSVGGRPILEILIQELTRYGVEDVLLLAAFWSESIEAFASELPEQLGRNLRVEVSVEPELAGTGGALHFARDRLANTFLMLNGDSLFDVDLTKLAELLEQDPGADAAVALRPLPETGRYDNVGLDGKRITRFGGQSGVAVPALINGGVYAMRRSILTAVTPVCSLERHVLPALARSGRLLGMVAEGFFLDIGVPEDFARAQTAIPKHRLRPAAFLDRDGVINRDDGHVGTVERLVWNEGVPEAIRMLNSRGFYVFVVTNQAGIGKGNYDESDYARLRKHIRETLLSQGARIDDERYCPYHPDAVIADYRRVSDWRKPAPGMILDLMKHWPIEKSTSFLIGDKPSDVAAAQLAGISGHLFESGRLDAFVEQILLQSNSETEA